MRNKCKTKNNIKTGQGGHFNNYDGLFNANSPLISESFNLRDKKLSEESLILHRIIKNLLQFLILINLDIDQLCGLVDLQAIQ